MYESKIYKGELNMPNNNDMFNTKNTRNQEKVEKRFKRKAEKQNTQNKANPNRKKNKIELNYKKYSKMSREELEEYVKPLGEKFYEIENKLNIKDKEIEGLKDSFDNARDENKQKALEEALNRAGEEGKILLLEKDKLEKEIVNVKNYLKNKDKIEKVIGYKNKIRENLKGKREEKAQLNKDLKSIKAEEKEIDNKLKNPKELDNNEYNEALKRKEEIKVEKEKLEKKIEDLSKSIESLTGSNNKCDLVWKNLMLGKSWDEIHLKALEMNKNKQPRQQKEVRQENTNTEMIEYNSFADKHPRLAKIANLFKKIKNKMSKNKEKNDLEVEGPESEEILEKPTNSRDAFVDQLRMMVEEDYKQQVRSAKNEQYKQVHRPVQRQPQEGQKEQEDEKEI